jgi:hypothetical protein
VDKEITKLVKDLIRQERLDHFYDSHNPSGADGSEVFSIGRVVGRNDPENGGKVRLIEINNPNLHAKDMEDGKIETQTFLAEVLSIAKGENHGVYYTPEFGDFVLYTTTGNGCFILGSISNPSNKFISMNVPAETQNIQKNGVEYNTSHYPNLNDKGYHKTDLKKGDIYQPAAFLQRWRKNDFLIYNATKINNETFSAVKLMELRSAESQMLQLVDLGNNHIRPGLDGSENYKKYSPVRQTDYRDLWEGFNVNEEFWAFRTEYPPEPHESQYVKLASNGEEYSEVSHGDVGSDLPDILRGNFRFDDRTLYGSHETSKTIAPVYQTVMSSVGDERYYQDKEMSTNWETALPHRLKIKMWIEDTAGLEKDITVKHFNVGHYLTLSNTIFKRRAMLSTKKGHQLVMSDIDKDEKILLNSHRGKHIYMEDSDPGHYDAMWFASQKHHMLFVDEMTTPFLIDCTGKERDKLVDPNQGLAASSYQLIQTEKYQKIWMADSPKCPRIHVHTTTGHEVLLLDHDQGTVGHMQDTGKGKIQITTNDKLMQITMDVENGDITIQNHNLGGKGAGGKPLTGDISIYAANNILLHAKNMIQMRADLGYDIQSSDGSYNVTACGISHSTPCGSPHIPETIRPSVLTDIETTPGSLINKFDPS